MRALVALAVALHGCATLEERGTREGAPELGPSRDAGGPVGKPARPAGPDGGGASGGGGDPGSEPDPGVPETDAENQATQSESDLGPEDTSASSDEPWSPVEDAGGGDTSATETDPPPELEERYGLRVVRYLPTCNVVQWYVVQGHDSDNTKLIETSPKQCPAIWEEGKYDLILRPGDPLWMSMWLWDPDLMGKTLDDHVCFPVACELIPDSAFVDGRWEGMTQRGGLFEIELTPL